MRRIVIDTGVQILSPQEFLQQIGIHMSTVSLQLPESLYRQLAHLAEQDCVSVDQLITLAIAEKVSALMTVEYIRERGKLGSRRDFEAILAKVPRVEPDEHDRL